MWFVYFRGYIRKNFSCLIAIDSSGNSIAFLALVIESVSLYGNLVSENIGYNKLLYIQER